MQKQGWLIAGGGILLFGGGLLVGRLNPSPAPTDGAGIGAGTKSSPKGGLVGGAENGSSRFAATKRDYSMGEILEDGDVGSRFEKLMAKLDRTESKDFQAILEDIAERGFNQVMGDERVLIISAWAKRDPLAAVQYLKEHDQGCLLYTSPSPRDRG